MVDASGSDVLKQGATWKVEPGLANKLCYSFASRHYPGEYLRHRDFRVRREGGDDSVGYREDATWCPVRGSGGIRLVVSDFPGMYLRHINAELWLAQSGGTHSWDTPAAFTEDTSWAFEAPWDRL